jgi:hypothetical protein
MFRIFQRVIFLRPLVIGLGGQNGDLKPKIIAIHLNK